MILKDNQKNTTRQLYKIRDTMHNVNQKFSKKTEY